jgi:hypothetical protein
LPQQLAQQQLQQQPNCDIYPFVITSKRQVPGQDSGGLQGLTNSSSAQGLNSSNSAQGVPQSAFTQSLNSSNISSPGIVSPRSDPLVRALAERSDPLVRAQAGPGGRVLFTKNGTSQARLNIPSGGVGLLQDEDIPSHVEVDLLGLHNRLHPDFEEVGYSGKIMYFKNINILDFHIVIVLGDKYRIFWDPIIFNSNCCTRKPL